MWTQCSSSFPLSASSIIPSFKLYWETVRFPGFRTKPFFLPCWQSLFWVGVACMTERACFSEQLSVGNLWFTRTYVLNGRATCAPPVRTCALLTLRPFCMLPSFLSQGLIKGGVLLRSGRTCVSASQVSCDQHWSWHLKSKWKQFWMCTDGIQADCSIQWCICECI